MSEYIVQQTLRCYTTQRFERGGFDEPRDAQKLKEKLDVFAEELGIDGLITHRVVEIYSPDE